MLACIFDEKVSCLFICLLWQNRTACVVVALTSPTVFVVVVLVVTGIVNSDFTGPFFFLEHRFVHIYVQEHCGCVSFNFGPCLALPLSSSVYWRQPGPIGLKKLQIILFDSSSSDVFCRNTFLKFFGKGITTSSVRRSPPSSS